MLYEAATQQFCPAPDLNLIPFQISTIKDQTNGEIGWTSDLKRSQPVYAAGTQVTMDPSLLDTDTLSEVMKGVDVHHPFGRRTPA